MLTATCLAESLQAALCLQEICVCHSLLLFSFAPLLFTKIYKTFTSGSLLPKKTWLSFAHPLSPFRVLQSIDKLHFSNEMINLSCRPYLGLKIKHKKLSLQYQWSDNSTSTRVKSKQLCQHSPRYCFLLVIIIMDNWELVLDQLVKLLKQIGRAHV